MAAKKKPEKTLSTTRPVGRGPNAGDLVQRMTLWLPQELYLEARIHCLKNNTTMTALLTDALRKALK